MSGKRIKTKSQKFWELISMFVEVTGEKLVGGETFLPSPILSRVNIHMHRNIEDFVN